jgi:hypothetical protein
MSTLVEPQIDEWRLLVVEVAGARIVRSSNLGAALAGSFGFLLPSICRFRIVGMAIWIRLWGQPSLHWPGRELDLEIDARPRADTLA